MARWLFEEAARAGATGPVATRRMVALHGGGGRRWAVLTADGETVEAVAPSIEDAMEAVEELAGGEALSARAT